MHLSVQELLHYTDEERQRWEQWFHENGAELLKMPVGGRHDMSVGALLLHVFGSEARCVQRLRHEPLHEYRERPCERIEEVFGFGLEKRGMMRDFVQSATDQDWKRIVELQVDGRGYRVSARKLVLYTLLHELRHWAHLERVMRDRGFEPPGEHGLLDSSALI